MFLRDSNSAEENSTDLGYPKTKADSPKKPFAGSNRVASALFSMCMWTFYKSKIVQIRGTCKLMSAGIAPSTFNP